MITSFRRDFPELEQVVHLNSAAMSLMPRQAKAALAEALADRQVSSEKRSDIRLGRENRTRHRIAKLIRCSPGEICMVTNTSEGLNIIAQGLNLRKGDNVVLGEREHIANVLPWLNLQKQGIHVKRVSSEYGRDYSDSLLAAVDDRTRVVAVSYVGWIDGFRLDLANIGRFCREREIYFSVDAIQGVGAMDLDVSASSISFLSCGGYKWLMSPSGTGFIYVRRDLLPELEPRYLSYLSIDSDAERFDFRIRLKDDATRFRLGSISDIGIAALERSLDMILGIGIQRVQTHITELNGYAARALAQKGYTIVSDLSPEHRSGIISFHGQDVRAKYDRLIARGIIVSFRNGGIRLSPHFYNNREDIERMLDVL